jgi:tetratricopeptide (TPR) repeat protein
VRRLGGGPLPALLLGAALLGGCAYYNGMYNTNRLAKSARKAERDGRTFEANNLWGQVVTRAESVVVRHPRSKYAVQASVLRGLGLSRLGDCPTALAPLGGYSRLARSSDLFEEAALALGRCHLELGDPAVAELALAPVLESRDARRRREADFQHLRALRLMGRYDEALVIARRSPDPRASTDLLLSLAGAGHTDEALALADSLIASGDSTIVWDSVTVVLGAANPLVATALVDRLNNRGRTPPDQRARRLYADALRLSPVDSARATARFRQAAAVRGEGEDVSWARLHLLRQALRSVRTPGELGPLADSLAGHGEFAGASATEAEVLTRSVARIREVTDSVAPGSERGDLKLFLAAESARDTLDAPVLAGFLFRRLADEWPASPYAPKALLASQLVDGAWADTTRTRLDSLYPDSPYLAVLRGEEIDGYHALEDSLARFAAAQAVAQPRTPGGQRRAPPNRGVRPPTRRRPEP